MVYRLLFIALLSVNALTAAELPVYLSAALNRFSPEISPEYAYTLTTRRGDDVSVERFDPSRPRDRQWTLLERNHQPATAEENARYSSYRITTAPNVRATFARADLDLATLHLVKENATHAEYRGRFRKDVADPMLHRLEIALTVTKNPAAIERLVLELIDPFSPVLTVKMLELRVETLFRPPIEADPALPYRTVSRFRGRVLLFKAIEEDIQTDYADFVKVTPFDLKPDVNGR